MPPVIKTITFNGFPAKYNPAELEVMREAADAVARGDMERKELEFLHEAKARFDAVLS